MCSVRLSFFLFLLHWLNEQAYCSITTLVLSPCFKKKYKHWFRVSCFEASTGCRKPLRLARARSSKALEEGCQIFYLPRRLPIQMLQSIDGGSMLQSIIETGLFCVDFTRSDYFLLLFSTLDSFEFFSQVPRSIWCINCDDSLPIRCWSPKSKDASPDGEICCIYLKLFSAMKEA
jgi:hypothetical protein